MRVGSRKRVCLVIQGAGWAGTERHVRSLVQKLPGRGFEVHLITSESGPLQALAREAGTEVHEVPRRSRREYLWSLSTLLRALRPHIVHSHSGRIPAWVARTHFVPRILDTRHGLLERLDPRLQGQGPRWRWEVAKCRAAHLTLTVAEADRDWLIEAGLSPDRIVTVYNGVAQPHRDSGRFDPGPAVAGSRATLRRIGLVGRLTSQKAPERALDLMRHLRGHGTSNCHLSVYGDGESRSELERTAREMGIEDCVTWFGVVDDVPARLQELDALILPSRAEGIPYVLLEALAAGLPVVATPVGGIGEVLSVPPLIESLLPWDVTSWAERVEEITTPGFRPEWAAAASARMQNFDEEVMVDRIVELYSGPNFR